MTRDDVLRWARECFEVTQSEPLPLFTAGTSDLERFASIVAADARARALDEIGMQIGPDDGIPSSYCSGWNDAVKECLDAIRNLDDTRKHEPRVDPRRPHGQT